MSLVLIDWLLLIAQLFLLAVTVFVGPFLLQPRWITYFVYTVLTGILWLACALVCGWFNSKVRLDVPGAGYLFIGFVGWLVGSTIYLFRIRRHRLKRAAQVN